MNRGEIHWVNLGEAIKPEIGKLRPALIVSNTEINTRLDSVVMVPLSSKAPEIWPLRIKIETSKLTKELPQISYAIILGIRQVSKTRLQKFHGTLNETTLQKVDKALIAYLSD